MRPGTVFYKMSGSGNDFLLFDGRYLHQEDFTPESIRAICDRRQGVGADGVIVLDPAAPKGAHFTFQFWNSDGSLGPMCGNGALCATRLAALIELAPAEGEVVFATPAGLHTGQVREGRPVIHLPDCALPKPLPAAKVEPAERSPCFANPSVPHLVLMVDDVDKVEVERRGPPLRRDPATGEGGANVNWVSPARDGGFRMRTWERGVEGETLACGTGAVACALVVGALGLAKSPVRLWTRSGLPLDVAWTVSGKQASSVTLSGEGRLVFRGIVGEPARQ
ncbi:MAG: diaminopimelate epimerase [Gemmatimonadales bacterium]